jgi:hypothetical protein
MQLTALVNYVPYEGSGLPAIAWIFGSPSKRKPARWKPTREWKRLIGAGADPQEVADMLDAILESLNQTHDIERQYQVLLKRAGHQWPAGIVWDTPELSREHIGPITRWFISDLAADQARYAERRARLHASV